MTNTYHHGSVFFVVKKCGTYNTSALHGEESRLFKSQQYFGVAEGTVIPECHKS